MNNLVAEKRNAKGLSQTELARRVGITRPYLSDIERGIKVPSVTIAHRIARELDCRSEALFFGHGVNHSAQRIGPESAPPAAKAKKVEP